MQKCQINVIPEGFGVIKLLIWMFKNIFDDCRDKIVINICVRHDDRDVKVSYRLSSLQTVLWYILKL